MNPLIEKLEKKNLPEFEEIAAKIRDEIPNIMVNVCSTSLGSLTEYQGWGFCIDCMLTDASYDEIDNVALSVTLFHLTTMPKIDADVCWGHPSGYVEAEFPDYIEGSSNNSLIVSDEVLEDLYKDLPRLYKALFEALKRRKPANE